MTTYIRENRQCAICGAFVNCTTLNSTNTFGSSDLDLRPPEMMRSTMRVWLQECTECRYVAGDIGECTDDVKARIASNEYQSLLSNDQLPELASRFLRFSLLNPTDPEASGLAKLRAAWACDDADVANLAQQCRSDAADRLLELQPFENSEKAATLATVLVDVLRRSVRYDESIQLIDELNTMTAVSENETIRGILAFQESLCRKEDTQCYTISDAVGESESKGGDNSATGVKEPSTDQKSDTAPPDAIPLSKKRWWQFWK
jgi:hypothetical protein